MPTPEPAGPYMVVMHRVIEMLADCENFQERCGLTYDDSEAYEKLFEGQDGATRHLFYPALEDVLWQDHFPLGVLMLGDRWTLRAAAGGSQLWLPNPERTLQLWLADWENDDYAGDLEASLRDFCNWIGLVARDLAGLSAVNENVPIGQIEQSMHPFLPSEEEQASLRSDAYPSGRNYWTTIFTLHCTL